MDGRIRKAGEVQLDILFLRDLRDLRGDIRLIKYQQCETLH